MSTIYDVDAVAVNDAPASSFSVALDNIAVEYDPAVTNINLNVDATPQTVQIETAGPQGPPGLKNVYVQPNDPAVEFGWGMAQKGFIWIEATV